jgi:hypothetical protein
MPDRCQLTTVFCFYRRPTVVPSTTGLSVYSWHVPSPGGGSGSGTLTAEGTGAGQRNLCHNSRHIMLAALGRHRNFAAQCAAFRGSPSAQHSPAELC